MRKLATALTLASAFAAAPAANALVITPCNSPPFSPAPCAPNTSFTVSGNPFAGPVSAGYNRSGLSGTGFDTFVFSIFQNGVGSGTLSSTLTGGINGFDDTRFVDDPTITGVDSGVNFSNDGGATWIPVAVSTFSGADFGLLSGIPIFNGAMNILRVNYSVGTTPSIPSNGSYGGALNFSPNRVAVPEPGTWAMMLVGFAAVGFAMRRRRKDQVRVRYAF